MQKKNVTFLEILAWLSGVQRGKVWVHQTEKEVNTLTSQSKSSAKSALDQMKYEVASEVGVNLKQGYNGDLSAKENGTVGGYMVKRMFDEYYAKHGSNN